ncbi:MAG TPA: Calx-beta domain-containing protein [Verrucomicrobiota bacterium]|nr:hypothetical protein [Verrucomicrobiales bacterium]HRI13613.1 Calx-beta domain-containing protein [Verrucomicrobiota bacterium]
MTIKYCLAGLILLARLSHAYGQAGSVVQFTQPRFDVIENRGEAVVSMSRAGDTNAAFTVAFAFGDGTARAGVDYVAPMGLVRFAAGETTKTLTIPVIDNASVDGDRTVQLILSNPANGALGEPSTAILWIRDNEIPGSLVDQTFDTGDNYRGLASFLVLPNDQLLACGKFWGRSIARFNPDGAVNSYFGLPMEFFPGGLALLPDGRVLVGAQIGILEYESTGNFKSLWDGTGSFGDLSVSSILIQTDGKVIAGGRGSLGAGSVIRFQANGQRDPSFQVPVARFDDVLHFGGTVNATALQPDGKILIAGRFSKVNDRARDHIARLESDGSVDDSFVTTTSLDWIQVMTLQPDGRILIGSTVGDRHSYLSRLNSDGSVDGTFDVVISSRIGPVLSLALQADGKILVATPGAVHRLNSNGTIDNSFEPGVHVSDGYVLAIGLQRDGKIIIGGDFRGVSSPDRPEEMAFRTSLARLYADKNYPVRVQFSSGSQSVSETDGAATVRVERIGESSGSFSINYTTADISAISGSNYTAQQGTLTFAPLEVAKDIVIPILDDGAIKDDRTFKLTLSNPSSGISWGTFRTNTVNIRDNDRILLDSAAYSVSEDGGSLTVQVLRYGGLDRTVSVGYFTTNDLPSGEECVGCAPPAIAGVDYQSKAGTVTFAPGETNKTIFIPVFDNGRVDGDRVFAITASGIDPQGLTWQVQSPITIYDNESFGAVDLSFRPGDGITSQQFGNGLATALAVQPDEQILIGGSFDTVGNVGRTNLARLNPDGTLDPSLIADINPIDPSGNFTQLSTMTLQTNGQILITGNFTSIEGVNVNGLARLNRDGSLDTNFNAFAGIAVTNQIVDQNGNLISPVLLSVAVQPDGMILIGGTFDTVNGAGRTNLARLNANGSLDTNFVAGTDLVARFPDGSGNWLTNAASVSALAVRPDGGILLGGTFTEVNGWERGSLALLDRNGTVKPGFLEGSGVVNGDGPGSVKSVSLQRDGAILIAGQFTAVHGTDRGGLARLKEDGSLDLNFTSAVALNGRSIAVPADTDEAVYIAVPTCNWGCNFTLQRVSSDGSLDGRSPGIRGGGVVNAMALQPNGDVLIAGSFRSITVDNTGQSIETPGIARLHGNPSQPRVQFYVDPSSGVYSADVIVGEEAGMATVAVQRVGDTSAPLKVDFTTSDGTATAAVNFGATRGTLSFAPLETAQTITIPILHDNVATGELQFQVALSHPSGGAALGLKTSTVHIQNTDHGFAPGGIVRESDERVILWPVHPPENFVLQASTNLVDWNALAVPVGTYTDTNTPLFNRRFFRLVPP